MNTRNLLLLVPLLLAGCVSSDYVGKSYPPTTNVDIYFSEADIKNAFEVMGEIMVETDDSWLVNGEKMQEKLVDEAKKKGADGVILSGLEWRTTGEAVTSSSETKVKDDRVKTTSKAESSVKEKKTLRAKLIKYKQSQ